MSEGNPKKSIKIDLLIIATAIISIVGLAIWFILSIPKLFKSDGIPTQKVVDKPVPAKEKTKPLKSFLLPRDAEALSRQVKYELLGLDFRNLKLKFEEPSKEIEIIVPAGTKIVHLESRDFPEFFIWKTANIKIGPRQYKAGELAVVGTDANKLVETEAGDHLIFNVANPNELIPRFIQLSERENLNWGPVQSGVWMLSQNISPEDFYKIRVHTYHQLNPMGGTDSIVAAYAGLKSTANIFQNLGLNPMDYHLLADSRNKFLELLKKVDFDAPSKNYTSIIVNKSLLAYESEPEVEKVLIRYLTEHPTPHIRLDALRNLTAMEVVDDAEIIFHQLKNETHRHVQFLFAYRLYKIDDPRSFPLLAVFEKDAELTKYFSNYLPAKIKKLSGRDRARNENLFNYWERVLGWDSLARDGWNSEGLRPLTEKLMSAPDPILVKALQQASSHERGEVNKAIHQLKSYRDSPEAFEMLVELTTKHEDGNTRFSAMNALTGFRDFKLKKICEDRILNDPDYRLAQVALNIAGSQKIPGFENLFLLACEHEHTSVRLWAVRGIGNHKIARGESLLLELANGDPERNIQYAALRSLTNGLKSYAVFPLLKEMLQSTEEADRWNALNNLKMWKSNPDALDMLEPYRNDPIIGSRVIPHLEKYGR